MINMPSEYFSPVSGGAIATVIREVAKPLVARGHSVYVLSIRGDQPHYSDLDVVDVKGIRVDDTNTPGRLIGKAWRNYYRWDYPRYSVYLKSTLRALSSLGELDAVVIHNDYALPYHVRRHLGPDVKILLHVHNEPASSFRFLSESVRSVDEFIAISGYIRGRLIKNFQLPPERVRVGLNGVSTERFHPRADAMELRPGRRVLFVGRVNPDKGPDVGARAVLRLRQEGLDVALDVAGPVWWHGEDAESNPFFREVRTLVEAGTGQMIGDVPRHDMPALMRRYDITCALSRWNEPYGLVVSEAMASGCAVWASNRGGIPEVLGDAGVQADPDDLDDVCAKLRPLLQDDSVLRERKQASLRRASELPWTNVVDVYEACMV